MRRTELRKLLRGSVKKAAGEVVALLEGPHRVEDLEGRVLVGAGDAAAPSNDIVMDGTCLGTAFGERSEELATVIGHLATSELEKRGLAEETLGRYKELTLLYEMSEQFSKLLDPESVAHHGVEQAQRHLRADAASLLILNPRRDALHAIAHVGETGIPTIPLAAGERSGVCARVFLSGHAELVELGDEQVLCAPLRHGESLSGVLQVRQLGVGWTAGDLKLVSAIAANVASALHKAQLHTDQVQAMALRHQMQRHTSPDLLEAVFDGPCCQEEVQLAVLFCDLRAASSSGEEQAPEALVERVDAALTVALAVLMHHGAVVDVPLGEMLVAVFWDPESFERAAGRAIAGATAMRFSMHRGVRMGIGVASGTLTEDLAEGLDATINAAARLHADADAKLLVDHTVSRAASGSWSYTPHGPPESGVFEVRTP